MLGEKESKAQEGDNGSKGKAIDKQVHLDEPVESTTTLPADNPTTNANRSTKSKEAKGKGLAEDDNGDGQPQESQRVNGPMLPPDPPCLLSRMVSPTCSYTDQDIDSQSAMDSSQASPASTSSPKKKKKKGKKRKEAKGF
ncbi:hypothetical protein OIU77_020395 [Salix suchowensis]|uniref:Uncharacterized protein n=1 Tax=Salix suchowensis TaxID=1278906 RepID=A0ABQ8ZGL1_9ROSI|nr:hypothetical protein OIU77_020395 [Salix suchowensis]